MASSKLSDQAIAAQRMYNARAVDYDDSWHPRHAADLAGLAKIGPGTRILDLACGTGLVTIAAAKKLRSLDPERKGHIVAVDVTDGMLAVAQASAEEQGFTECITFIKHDIIQLDDCTNEILKKNSFDVITCASCLPLLSYPGAAIKSWVQYLRPGGQLIADVPSEESQVPGLVFEEASRACGYSLPWGRGWIKNKQSLEDLYREAGLAVEQSLFWDGYRSAKGPYPVEDGEKIIDSYLASPAGFELQQHGEEKIEMIRQDFLRRWRDRAVDGVVDEVEGFYVVIGSKA